jgi:hypothetical protein
MTNKTLISQDAQLKAALLKRGDNTGAVGLRDLQRYYALLNYHLLEFALTAGEANLICEVLQDYCFETDPEQARMIWRRINDAMESNQLHQKWRVNGEALISKLQRLTHLQAMALVDAVERYWLRAQSHPQEPVDITLSRVDLLKCCDSAL